jgi:hypothetical protein
MKAVLAGYVVGRRVNARGLVSIYGRNYSVGRRHAGQAVYVRFDPAADEWVVEASPGAELARAAAGLSLEAIQGFAVTCRHRGKRASRRAANQAVA